VYCLVIVQLLVSGGVDSTVCAALLHKALCEDQVIAVHIDNGFMRKNESQRVEQSLEKLGLRVKGSVRLNVNERVLSSLLELSYTQCIERTALIPPSFFKFFWSTCCYFKWYFCICEDQDNVVGIVIHYVI